MTKINLFTRREQAALSTAVALALFGSIPAHAAIDITAATAGIADASTAVLAVLAALITMGVAIWGVKRVYKFFKG